MSLPSYTAEQRTPMTNDQLRERISDSCYAEVVESWMDLEEQAELKAHMRATIGQYMTDDALAELRAAHGDEDALILELVASLPCIAPEHAAERAQREAIGRRLNAGPKHGRN